MHKNPYKHRFIAGSSKCLTKPLFILLPKLLTHIKQGLQKYCETAYSRSGVNQMWILKNSKELLDHLQSPNFNLITNIKSFDFSTLYTTIPHQKRKSRPATILLKRSLESVARISLYTQLQTPADTEGINRSSYNFQRMFPTWPSPNSVKSNSF